MNNEQWQVKAAFVFLRVMAEATVYTRNLTRVRANFLQRKFKHLGK